MYRKDKITDVGVVLVLSFYHLFSTYLLIVFYMPDTLVESEDKAVSKIQLSWRRGLIINVLVNK